MKRTLSVTGMKCMHCENRAKKALEALPQVDSAEASAAEGKAVVTLNAEISNEELKAAIVAAGYEVTSVE